MNCRDFEQLFDAYLDGELGGAMRLEFDAHRLRCTQCQRSLAMMQSIGSAITAQEPGPIMSAEFTDRVMAQIAAREPALRRRRIFRLVGSGVGLTGIAAAVFLAFTWNPAKVASDPVATLDANRGTLVAANDGEAKEARAAEIRDLLGKRMEERLGTLHSAGREVTADYLLWKQYFNNITVPEYIARAASQLVEAAPMSLLQIALPDDSEDTGVDLGADEYSL